MNEYRMKLYDKIRRCGNSKHIHIPFDELRRVDFKKYYRIEIVLREVD